MDQSPHRRYGSCPETYGNQGTTGAKDLEESQRELIVPISVILESFVVDILLLVESLTFMEAIQHTLVNASLQHWIPAFAGMTCFTMPPHNQSYPRRRALSLSSQLSQGSAVELR
jgi:hypothetical protein